MTFLGVFSAAAGGTVSVTRDAAVVFGSRHGHGPARRRRNSIRADSRNYSHFAISHPPRSVYIRRRTAAGDWGMRIGPIFGL